MPPESKVLTPEVTDAFFRYAGGQFPAAKRTSRSLAASLCLRDGTHTTPRRISLARQADGLETAVVTNGYTLGEYVELLTSSAIREIQVTLDGVGEIHDRRRPLKGGQATLTGWFRESMRSWNAAYPSTSASFLTGRTSTPLPDLARFAVSRGWTARPGFKTQLGRNYELHTCQADPRNLFTRVELYEKIHGQIAAHPEILDFHRPAFSLARFLWENGELPEPLFDSCPGTKGEWAFDYTGRIYSCTATVGKSGEELGTFHPTVTRNEQRIADWEERDVTAIPSAGTATSSLPAGAVAARWP